MSKNLNVDDALLAMAASVADRACELLTDGWVKGAWHTGEGGVEKFCIHGAVDQAMDELFGHAKLRDVQDLAIAFIVDEAANQYQFKAEKSCSWIGGWNDQVERKHNEVISVVGGAGQRLWGLVIEKDSVDSQQTWTPSKWVESDVNSPIAQEFLYAELS